MEAAIAHSAEAQALGETEQRVLDALADERWDFRTISGVARATGLPEDRVAEAVGHLEESDLVRQSHAPGPDGTKLYTLSSRPVSRREELAATQAMIAKDVP